MACNPLPPFGGTSLPPIPPPRLSSLYKGPPRARVPFNRFSFASSSRWEEEQHWHLLHSNPGGGEVLSEDTLPVITLNGGSLGLGF